MARPGYVLDVEVFVEMDAWMIATKIAYFVHDLTDPAVHRRMQMLKAGGATITAIGFRRGQKSPNSIQGMAAVELGRTTEGRLARRMLSVAGALARANSAAAHVRGSDVILARNLEMLVLGALARRLHAPHATLVYESLDIHRLLLDRYPLGSILRFIESTLWREVDLLLTSSPAFVRNYFLPRHFHGPIRIEENKVLDLEDATPIRRPPRPPAGPPWRIGWFGMIRCRKSLRVLSALADAAEGAIQIIIRGRPSTLVFPDFEAELKDLRNIRYLGPYSNPADLSNIYGEVHFSWTIDYFEAGQNSAWLLPCRLYEGSLFGAVPIAEEGVETSNWLVQRGAGVILKQPVERHLRDFIGQLNQAKYAELSDCVAALPRQDLVTDHSGCESLLRALRNPV
jgi:succinoglycan biosynthesis protein ExoL